MCRTAAEAMLWLPVVYWLTVKAVPSTVPSEPYRRAKVSSVLETVIS